MKICVFGAASDKIDKGYIESVEKLGEELAKRGHKLVFGAGANGLMGAVARGVKKQSGHITGIIPKFFREENIEAIFEECDDLIFTETMAERKSTMENMSDAFIIVPGGVGTFEEFFQVFTAKQLARHTKPIAIFDINGYYKKLDEFLKDSVKEKFICETCNELCNYTDNIDEVFSYIENDRRIVRDVHDLKNG